MRRCANLGYAHRDSFTVNSKDRARMEAIISDRDSSQKHVWRCRIVLLTAAGAGTHEIMRTAGVSKTAVWRWQERFMQGRGWSPARQDPTVPGASPF